MGTHDPHVAAGQIGPTVDEVANRRGGEHICGVSIAPYALSILRRQSLLMGDDFLRRYPHDWLVWEAGPWRPASSRAGRDILTTLQPGKEGPARPEGEDCLCFPLQPFRGRISVGRATTNQIVLNDLTASREHLQFEHDGTAWRVSALRRGTLIDTVELGDSPVELHPGAHIHAGAVTLTFHTSAHFLERVREATSPRAGTG